MIKKFKDENSNVHEIKEGFERLLPSGCTEITEQEAIELLAPTLLEYKELKVSDLYLACSLHILGGFTSDALGAFHTYPSGERDQANLNGVVTESIINVSDNTWGVPFWCADASDLWDRRRHTHSQIQQVGQAAAIHVRNAQDKLKGLAEQVNDAATNTKAMVDAIVW